MSATVIALVAVTIALTYLLDARRAAPGVAIALWMAVLGLRAAAAVALAVLGARYLPTSAAVAMLTHWCWRAVIPLLTLRLGFSGQTAAHAAAVLPGILVAISFASAVWGLLRAAGMVQRLLRARDLGTGPMGSVIVGGANVNVAAAGLTRPRVIVSAGALVHLNDAELAACLAHERGHIAHRHRFALLWGQLCGALSTLLPGGARAWTELSFHVERDADAYAIARTGDRRALASAICKAVAVDPSGATQPSTEARRAVAARIRLLMGRPPAPRSVGRHRLAVVATGAACLLLAVAAPGLAATAGAAARSQAERSGRCVS